MALCGDRWLQSGRLFRRSTLSQPAEDPHRRTEGWALATQKIEKTCCRTKEPAPPMTEDAGSDFCSCSQVALRHHVVSRWRATQSPTIPSTDQTINEPGSGTPLKGGASPFVSGTATHP